MLIVLGPRPDVHRKYARDDRNVQVSMSGRAVFTMNEMNEMNLAILEGQNVLENANRTIAG